MNSILQWYRQTRPDDPASDEEIILDYGSSIPLEELPEDFVADYRRVSQQRAVTNTTLGEQVSSGLTRGWKNLQATGAGALSLAAGGLGLEGSQEFYQDIFRRKVKEAEEQAPASVPAIEGAFDSPSALIQYLGGKAGEIAPGMAESLVMAGAGTLAAPGPGTAVGGAAGLFTRAAARSGLKRMVEGRLNAEVRKEIEEYAAGRLVGKALSKEADAIIADSAKYLAGVGTSIADAATQGAGYQYGLLKENPDVSEAGALAGAAAGAVGGSIGAIIPIQILKGIFGERIGEQAARNYVDLYAKQVPAEILTAGGGMGAQEVFNILGEKYADPKTRYEGFTEKDVSRVINAFAMGGIAGVPAAAIRAFHGVAKPEKAPGVEEAPAPAPALEAPTPVAERVFTPAEAEALFPAKVTAEQELVMRQIAERELANELTDADTSYLEGLQPAVMSRYEKLKTEVSNAAQKRKKQKGVQRERPRSDALVRQEGEDRTRPPIQPEKGPADGPGDVLPQEEGVVETPVVPAPKPPEPPKPAEPPPPTAPEIAAEAAKANPDPTPEQAQAGNYQKGHVDIYGLDISLENAKGSIRRNKDPKGPPWEVTMPAHYGQILGTKGKDGDPIDVYVGDTPESTRVFVIDQQDADSGKFDEHKVMMGFQNPAQAITTYLRGFSDGRGMERYRSHKELSIEEFKKWLQEGDQSKPIAEAEAKIATPTPAPKPPPVVEKAKQMAVTGEAPKKAPTVEPDQPTKPWREDIQENWSGMVPVGLSDTKTKMYREVGKSSKDNQRTKAIGVFQTPDGNILLATVYQNKGDKVYFPGKGKSWEDTLAAKYVPVATLRTNQRRRDVHEVMSLLEWHQIEADIEKRVSQAKQTVADVRTSADVGAEATATGAVTPEGLAVSETKRVGNSIGQQVLSDKPKATTREHAELLHDTILRTWGSIPDTEKDRGAAREAFIDAAERNPKVFKRILDEAGGKQASTDVFLELIERYVEAVDAFHESGATDPEQFRSQIVKALEGVSAPKREAGAETTGAPEDSLQARPARVSREPGTPEQAAVGTYVVERLNRAGIPVQKFQSNVTNLADGFAQSMGSYDRGRKSVAWALSDLSRPNRTDLRVLFEEAGHALFDRESAEAAAPVLRAVAQLDKLGGADVDAARADIANAYPNGINPRVYQEELLVGVLSRKLADEGFNPQQSGGIARAVVRLVKELYFKAAMWVQQNLLGEQYNNPDLAMRYWQNRLEGFLSGDHETLSWIDRLGGGKASVTRQMEWNEPVEGSRETAQTYNPMTGRIDSEPVVLDSVEAAIMNGGGENMRYSIPAPGSTEPYVDPAIRINRDASVNNEVEYWRQRAADRAGMELDEFRLKENLRGDTKRIRQVLDQEADAKGATGYNSGQRIEAFANEENYGKSWVAAAARLKQDAAKIGKNLASAREEIPRAVDRHERHLNQMEVELDRYTDATYMADLVKKGFRDLAQEQFRNERRGSQTMGVIMQQLRAIDEAIDRPVDPKAVNALKKLFTGSELDQQNLYELLDQLANDPEIDFSQTPGRIKQLIRERAELIPDYQPYQIITSNTPEGKALLAAVVGFGKYHRRTMALLGMRRMKSGEERGLLESDLKNLRKETTELIRKGIKQVARGAKLEEAARLEYRKLLRKAESEKRHIDRLEARIKAGEEAMAVYQEGINKIASKISQTADTTFGDGMTVKVPNAEGTKWEDKRVNLNAAAGPVTTPAEIKSWADQQAVFIKARQARAKAGDETALGLDYQRVLRQQQEILNNRFYQAAMRNTDQTTTGLMLGSASKTLDAVGTPTGNLIGNMLRRYQSTLQSTRTEADRRFGFKNSRLNQNLLGIINRGRKFADKVSHDWFNKWVMDTAIGFMEKMQPTEGGNRKADLDRGYQRLGEYLLSLDYLRPYISGRMAEFMPALREYMDSLGESGAFWINKIKEAGLLVEDRKLGESILRQHFRVGLLTVPRKFSDTFLNMVHAMRNSGWSGNGRDEHGAYGDFALASKLYARSPDALREILAKYFDHSTHGGTVRDDFVNRLAHMPDESPFMTPPIDDAGTTVKADPMLVAKAYDESGGDIVKWFENLFQEYDGTGNVGDYIQQNLLVMSEIFHGADKATRKVEPRESSQVTSLVNLVPNAMIDARAFEHWPSEWFSYHRFDRNDNARIAERVSGQINFGRDTRVLANSYQTLLEEVGGFEAKLKDVLSQALKYAPSGRKTQIDAEAAKILDKDKSPGLDAFKTGKEKLDYLRKIQSRAPLVRQFLGQMSDYFDRANQDVGSLRWGVRLAQQLASLMVQNPGSALQQLSTMFDFMTQWGASKSMLGATGDVVRVTAKDLVGSLMQSMGLQMKLSEDEKAFVDLGLHDPEVARKFGDAYTTLEGEQQNRAAQAFRIAKEAQGFTLNRAGENAGFTALRPLAPFTQLVYAANRGLTIGAWRLAKKYVSRATEYLKAHPGTERVTADDLGLKGLEKDGFDRFWKSAEGYGLNLTEMAKAAVDREKAGDKTLLTNQERLHLYSLALNEVSLENNIATMPLGSFNNSVVRFISPLLGWSFRRALQVAGHTLNTKDQRSLKAASTALLGLGAAGLGGLGLSLVVDAYQEDVIGKRRNIRDLRVPTSANDWIAIQERLNRIGTFGLFGDLINGAVNIGTGQGDNRMLSADQRVVALQSFQALQQALSALINQDFDPDYQHVVRPVIAAMGGNGMLQYMQLANRAFGLDNVESRTVKRINAQNYLRVVGRDMEMPVRVSSRGYATPTAMTPWVARMEFATYANSPEDFREAYKGALRTAKELGKPDPAEYVKRAFETRHPLRYVFTQVPTEAEYRRMLSAMSDDGREAVTEALRMFNYYGAHLGMRPFAGSTRKRDNAARARSMAGF